MVFYKKLGKIMSSLIVLALLTGGAWLLSPALLSQANGRTQASCGTGLDGTISNDIVLSGTVFIDGDVLFRDGADVEIMAGTVITMCGPYDIRVNNEASLKAMGTATNPIIITPTSTITHWGYLELSGSYLVTQTVLQYVELHYGGGTTPDSSVAALSLNDTFTSGEGVGPLLENLTITGSGSHGLIVDGKSR